jgi:hypothetical protein
MIGPAPSSSPHIGQTFHDALIMAFDGSEYLSCKFVNCHILKASEDTRCKFYECEFDTCVFEGFKPEEFS